MGTEMTLLRALAFHPHKPLPEPESPLPRASQPTHSPLPHSVATAPVREASPGEQTATALPNATSQILQARHQLMRQQGIDKAKKSEPAAQNLARPAKTSALERLASVTDRIQATAGLAAQPETPAKPEAYRWTSQTVTETVSEPVATPKSLKKALEHEKTPELVQKLAIEASQRDIWSAEIDKLKLPKLVQQLALNAWKEQHGVRCHRQTFSSIIKRC